MKQANATRIALAYLLLVLGGAAQAQFVAFNDHYQGPNSNPNDSFWNVYGTTGGAPGNSGPLKNILTGANLPVTLTIQNVSATGGTTSGSPSAGTPASSVFNGYIDWGTAAVNDAVMTAAGASISYNLTGLDPTRRYSLKATAVRGGGYADRWELMELQGAASFRNAHTSGCLTNGRADVTGNPVLVNQVAVNTGANLVGDLADWEEIDPGADGSITVVCTQYLGPIPGGASAGGSYAYAITALRLEEFLFTQTPASLTAQPTNLTVTELAPATFSAGVAGNPTPGLQWYRNGVVVPGATNASYTITEAQVGDQGAVFRLVAANVASNVSYAVTSSAATLTVLHDTNPPTLLSGLVLGLGQVQATFSKKLLASSANNASHYTLTNAGGQSFAVTAAALDLSQTNVILSVATLAPGDTYFLTVNGVTDRTAAQNPVPPNSRVSFLATVFTPLNIGAPALLGSVVASNGGFSLVAGGTDIGGTSDQFFFYYQAKAGDFDVTVRLAGFSPSDLWAKAGLMARETLDAPARFAAVLGTPSLGGESFVNRATVSGTAATSGYLPINYPYLYARLQRVGNVFTGYGSWDGQTWTPLGSANMAVATTLYLGLAGCSHNAGQTTTVQFRDYMNGAGGTVGTFVPPLEPPGPSTRKSPIAITEIMYNPAPRTDGKQLEFIELFNSNPFYEDLSGFRLTGDVDYTFPSNTVLQGGAYLLLAKVPADVQSYYGLSGVLGYGVAQYQTNILDGTLVVTTNIVNGLNAGGGTVQLLNTSAGLLLEVKFSNKTPWPVGADGTGHSLVLARPSLGEGSPEAWAASDTVDGSPGGLDGYTPDPLRNVVINEFLAHTNAGALDYIELYNHSNRSNDLSGCVLTTNPNTNRFVIPSGTIVPPRGFVAFDRDALGFGLSSLGDTIYFKNPSGRLLLDVVSFEAQAEGVAMGRFPDGASQFYPLQAQTPGAANSAVLVHDIVINELMFSPITDNPDDQYIELYNKGTNAVDLTGWQFTAGINFTLPSRVLGPDRYLVVARSVTNLLAKYSWLNTNNTVGDFGGSLKGGGERVALAYPEYTYATNAHGAIKTNAVYVVVDEVSYGGGGQWGHWSHGGGSSLELIDPRANHRLPSNWADSDETAKAPWSTIEATGLMDNGSSSAISIEGGLLSEGECLLDNVELFVSPSGANLVPNPNFESGMAPWTARGTQSRTSLEETGGFGGGRCLHVRASDKCDYIPNRIYALLSSVPSGTITIRYRVRWLCGWPEFLLRTHGQWFEAAGPMAVPGNLGTPGLRNSRALSNAAPVIYEVACNPVLPAASQPAVVTARVDDPDGVAAINLLYRVDPATTYLSVPMVDDGTGNDAVAHDGLYTAAIPGQAAGVLVAYQIQARDAALVPQSLIVPTNTTLPLGQPHEFLVRFGEPSVPSAFGTYRIWMTQNSLNAWINRPVLANEPIQVTFVYDNCRAVHLSGARYAASPWHQGFTSPLNDTHYAIKLPGDDLVLGTDNFNKIHAPGNGAFDDNTLQREQTGHWIGKQIHVLYQNRRFVHFYINGVLKRANALMEDMQTPGPELLEEYFPNDAKGHLYKTQVWWEGDDTPGNAQSVGGANQSWCTLNRYTTVVNGQTVTKASRYRWNWFIRSVQTSANDRTNVVTLIDTASANINTPTWAVNLEAQCDMEEILRTWAVRHSIGDWDFFGSRNGQNSYWYKPLQGRWNAFMFDMNIIIGNGSNPAGGNLFEIANSPPTETVMNNFVIYPYFRRMYLRALKEICTSAFPAAKIGPVVDAKYNAFRANGVSPADNGAAIKSWIESARVSILATIAAEEAPSFSITGTNYLVSSNNLLTISGVAPVEIKYIKVNGKDYPVIWSTNSVKGWTIRLTVDAGTNQLSFQGYDYYGNPTTNAPALLTVNYRGQQESPLGNVVINEIMYNPAVSNAAYVEIYNASPTFAYDLSGWELRGVGYTFPQGTILAPGGFLVLVENRLSFIAAYGATVPIFDVFPGALQFDGETLTLIQPGVAPAADVVIDKVRYDSQKPWPQLANGGGYSAQLIDPKQDHSRPCNWGDVASWRYVSATGTAIANSRLVVLLASPGEVYLDDLAIVPGTTAGVGSNFVRNGDFELPIRETTPPSNFWLIPTNYTNTTLSFEVKHSGSSSLHIVCDFAREANNYMIQQILSPSPTNNQICTLSYWYYNPSGASNVLKARIVSSGLVTTPSILPVTTSPGTNNAVAAILAPIPPLWINEIQPSNVNGLTDHTGQHGPWLELYNAGSNAVSLANLFLTDNYSNLTQWPFPAGATLAAGEFRVVFVDGHPERSTASEWHTSFAMNPLSGSVALTRLSGESKQVLDYINYAGLYPNYAYGSYPDGQPFARDSFYYATPGAPNTNASAPLVVFINEWMAANQSVLLDPVGNKYDDWFELYNPTAQPQTLDGFYLTDTLANPLQYRIPPGYIIPPHGFLLVWADGTPGRNTTNGADLHVSFKMSKGGESLALFGADGRMIDGITYGPQTNDVSEGRFPDGASTLVFMTNSTPRLPNQYGGSVNHPPHLDAIPDFSAFLGQTVSFTATASDADQPLDTLAFSLDPGAPAGATVAPATGLFSWTPLPEQTPSTNRITLRVTDSGHPPLSDATTFTVVVRGNTAPVLDPIGDRSLHLGQSLSIPLTAHDAEAPPQVLTFSLDTNAPAGARIDPASGLFTWTPAADQASTSNRITVRVTDNGQPPLTASQSFAALVGGRLQLAPATLEGTQLILSWASVPGLTYRVLSRDDLGTGSWTPLADVPATGSLTTYHIQTASPSWRFYRVVAP